MFECFEPPTTTEPYESYDTNDADSRAEAISASAAIFDPNIENIRELSQWRNDVVYPLLLKDIPKLFENYEAGICKLCEILRTFHRIHFAALIYLLENRQSSSSILCAEFNDDEETKETFESRREKYREILFDLRSKNCIKLAKTITLNAKRCRILRRVLPKLSPTIDRTDTEFSISKSLDKNNPIIWTSNLQENGNDYDYIDILRRTEYSSSNVNVRNDTGHLPSIDNNCESNIYDVFDKFGNMTMFGLVCATSKRYLFDQMTLTDRLVAHNFASKCYDKFLNNVRHFLLPDEYQMNRNDTMFGGSTTKTGDTFNDSVVNELEQTSKIQNTQRRNNAHIESLVSGDLTLKFLQFYNSFGQGSRDIEYANNLSARTFRNIIRPHTIELDTLPESVDNKFILQPLLRGYRVVINSTQKTTRVYNCYGNLINSYLPNRLFDDHATFEAIILPVDSYGFVHSWHYNELNKKSVSTNLKGQENKEFTRRQFNKTKHQNDSSDDDDDDDDDDNDDDEDVDDNNANNEQDLDDLLEKTDDEDDDTSTSESETETESMPISESKTDFSSMRCSQCGIIRAFCDKKCTKDEKLNIEKPERTPIVSTTFDYKFGMFEKREVSRNNRTSCSITKRYATNLIVITDVFRFEDKVLVERNFNERSVFADAIAHSFVQKIRHNNLNKRFRKIIQRYVVVPVSIFKDLAIKFKLNPRYLLNMHIEKTFGEWFANYDLFYKNIINRARYFNITELLLKPTFYNTEEYDKNTFEIDDTLINSEYNTVFFKSLKSAFENTRNIYAPIGGMIFRHIHGKANAPVFELRFLLNGYFNIDADLYSTFDCKDTKNKKDLKLNESTTLLDSNVFFNFEMAQYRTASFMYSHTANDYFLCRFNRRTYQFEHVAKISRLLDIIRTNIKYKTDSVYVMNAQNQPFGLAIIRLYFNIDENTHEPLIVGLEFKTRTSSPFDVPYENPLFDFLDSQVYEKIKTNYNQHLYLNN